MICDKCHMAQASVVVNHVINGRASVFNFCERCARDQGLISGSRLLFKLPLPNFGLVIPSNFYPRKQDQPNLMDFGQFDEMVVKPFMEKEGRGETYLEKKITELKKERDKAVKNEDYRSAAMLRDRIKELKKELS